MKNLFLSGACFTRAAGLLMFVQFFVFVSCAENFEAEGEEAAVSVRTIPVTVRETPDEIKGFGSLSFQKKFELSSPSDGILERLNFREGDAVKKGDIVGVIKNPQINLAARRAEDAYAQALSALDLAKARLRDNEFQAEARILEREKFREELLQGRKALEEERRKNQNREALYEAGGLSDEAIREERFKIAQTEAQLLFMEKEFEIREIGLREDDLVRAGYTVPSGKEELKKTLVEMATSAIRAEAAAARANMEAAAREMESCRIMERELVVTSPGSGVVGARYIEEGERLKRDDKIITVMDTGFLYAVFPVPESESPKLEKGMAARVISGEGGIHEGKVDLISPQADYQSFTFLVRVLLVPGAGTYLKPGMFAKVSVPLESPKKITVIPETALAAKKENSGTVMTVQNNTVSKRDVVLGALSGGEREIISGLSAGEVVVLFPDPALREGVYVSAAD